MLASTTCRREVAKLEGEATFDLETWLLVIWSVSPGRTALVTLFALVPLRSLGNLSFPAGLLLNEVPIVGFYWRLIWTALAFVQGDINSAGGWGR